MSSNFGLGMAGVNNSWNTVDNQQYAIEEKQEKQKRTDAALVALATETSNNYPPDGEYNGEPMWDVKFYGRIFVSKDAKIVVESWNKDLIIFADVKAKEQIEKQKQIEKMQFAELERMDNIFTEELAKVKMPKKSRDIQQEVRELFINGTITKEDIVIELEKRLNNTSSTVFGNSVSNNPFATLKGKF